MCEVNVITTKVQKPLILRLIQTLVTGSEQMIHERVCVLFVCVYVYCRYNCAYSMYLQTCVCMHKYAYEC